MVSSCSKVLIPKVLRYREQRTTSQVDTEPMRAPSDCHQPVSEVGPPSSLWIWPEHIENYPWDPMGKWFIHVYPCLSMFIHVYPLKNGRVPFFLHGYCLQCWFRMMCQVCCFLRMETIANKNLSFNGRVSEGHLVLVVWNTLECYVKYMFCSVLIGTLSWELCPEQIPQWRKAVQGFGVSLSPISCRVS